jgi:CrcB protein
VWERVLLVALGGALGALSRYGVSLVVVTSRGSGALGTLAVNIAGTLALGVIAGLADSRFDVPSVVRAGLVVGFLGAYTTFSTLMFETVDLTERGSLAAAALNLGGSVLLGVLAMVAGLALGRNLA